jgi:hypothetical protein
MSDIGNKLDVFTDFSLRLREFILSTYDNLPNTIFVSALLLGLIQGNLAMVWTAVGLAITAFLVAIFQELLGFVFASDKSGEAWEQVYQKASHMCTIIKDIEPASKDLVVVAPSYWFSSVAFFLTFIVYNAVQVAMRPAAKGVDPKKIDVRLAFSGSVILISIFFFALILLRGFSQCETWLGASSGLFIGTGMALIYWNILNVCNSGVPPDILNIVSATAPARENKETPVLCTT